MGADELLAGYARHRTAFKRGGLEELEREVGVDVARSPRRNLGRDDRASRRRGARGALPVFARGRRALCEDGPGFERGGSGPGAPRRADGCARAALAGDGA